MCPKSNETGVIKALLKNTEIYQSQIPLVIPIHLKTLVHSLFYDLIHSWNTFSGIFLSSVVAAILMESMSKKWVSFRTDLILENRKKSHGARWGNMGVFQSCNIFFCEKLANTQGCVSRSVIMIERPCVAFSFRIPTPRPNSEPNRLL